MTPLDKYLTTYATKFNFVLNDFVCDASVVLPTFGEKVQDVEEVLYTLKEAATHSNKNILAILVVNQRATAKAEYKQKNLELLKHYDCEKKEYAFNQTSPLPLLILNYTSERKEFSKKEGVGLARKIGCDLAALLYANQRIRSAWIYTTDIDARVSKDYFNDEEFDKDTALKIFPFRHRFEQTDGESLLLYDIWLRYYTLSLRKAGSPFSFSTLGSTFCIHASAYAKVRGFPNRLAAEDFHLARKLFKVGKIQYSKLSPLSLIGRESDRVPFGTGVGTSKYTKSKKNNEEVKFINPLCFDLLREFLVSARKYIEDPTKQPLNIHKEIDEALHLSEIIQTAIATRTNTKDRLLHFRTAFDALKTLRFVHLAEQYYPKVAYEEALKTLNPRFDTHTSSLLEISNKMAKEEMAQNI